MKQKALEMERKLKKAYVMNRNFVDMIIETRNILSVSVLSDKDKCKAIKLIVRKYQLLWEGGSTSNIDKSSK